MNQTVTHAVKRNAAMLACLVFASPECWAQATSAEAFDQLGKQLEEIQRTLTPPPPPEPGRTDRRRRGAVAKYSYEPVVQGAIEQAIKLMEHTVRQFRDNQWVRVKGFKVTVGLSPSVDIDFEVPQTSGSTAR